MVFCFRSLRVRGRGFRCSLLTATCPVGREGGSRGWEDWGPRYVSAGCEGFTFWQIQIPSASRKLAEGGWTPLGN